MNNIEIKRRGRPTAAPKQQVAFDPSSIQLVRGSELEFDISVFTPIRTDTILDDILSTSRGLMPATNMVICGGPGSGKSTVVLDMLSKFTAQGYKCLFVSGEMDEIGHYKYCRRMPAFANVETLFLKNYSTNIKETLEYVFNLGYEVIALDSIAEIVDMYKDTYKVTEGAAEMWLLDLQAKHKKGQNPEQVYTAFINIQQVTKAGDFAGSNRLKHMTDAMCEIKKEKDGLSRTLKFSKNRDGNTDIAITFHIGLNQVEYRYEQADDGE